ncbi:MAG: response regulator [Dongiaceae bacterium]
MQVRNAMRRILLVEDEALVAMPLVYALEEAGYNVVLASDGREGLERALEQTPDLIISDYMMPRMTGVEMIQRIRKAGVTIPIILLTAVPERNLPRDPGHNLFLSKPYDESQLLDAVRQLVNADINK